MHRHMLMSMRSSILILFAIVVILINITPARAYTVSRYTWPGYTTTYGLDADFVSRGWSSIAHGAASDWNNASSNFSFTSNSSSLNRIKTNDFPPDCSLARTYSFPGANLHWSYFDMEIFTGCGHAFYDGTQAPSLPSNYYDLRSIIRHELGHAIGLCHSVATSNLMHVSLLQGNIYNVDNDARDGVSYLYNSAYTGNPPELACWLSSSAAPTPPGTYDDRHSPISYGGRADAWVQIDGPYGTISDTMSRINNAGGKTNITFTGDRISYIYSLDPTRGAFYVYIDGVLRGYFSGYAAETRRQVIRTWAVSSGSSHTFEVRAAGGGTTDLDAMAVNIASVGSGIYDDTNTHFRFYPTGAWTLQNGVSGAYNTTQTYANTAGSFFRFTFTGSQITYYFSKANNRGIAAVTIDGNDYGYVDMYSPNTQRGQSVTYSGLGSGTHTINITVTGYRNPASQNFVVDVDRLTVTTGGGT